MIKFWLTLIFGTIIIAGGLTYLKLYRGAQTISYPAPAPKTKPPVIEFINTMSSSDEAKKMSISANVVSFVVKESKADKPNEVNFKINNTGEGPLVLSLRQSSCTCTDIYVDQQQVTLTNHEVKVAPGQTALVRLIYTPKFDPERPAGEKTRLTATFASNDERFSDHLHFEVETEVKR